MDDFDTTVQCEEVYVMEPTAEELRELMEQHGGFDHNLQMQKLPSS